MSHSDETRAAVMAALMAGQSINKVAEEYHLSTATVSRWRNEGVLKNETQKKEIGELITDYLKANLDALRAQADLFQDRAWLKKQSAADAAVLHGVMTDKAIRLLEALSRDSDA